MRNTSLDLLKLIAAYMVVFIHVNFSGMFGEYVIAAATFAVPLFFMVSGYFSYNSDVSKILKKAKHIIMMFCISEVIYIIYFFIEFKILGNPYAFRSYIKQGLEFYNLVKFLLYNETHIIVHLWFLPALLYCYIIFYIVKKANISNKICYIFYPYDNYADC